MHSLAEWEGLIRAEFDAMTDEGIRVKAFRTRFERILSSNKSEASRKSALGALYDDMSGAIEAAAESAAEEPSDLDGIRRLRPKRPPRPPRPSKSLYRDRLYGAWLGRVAGCILGKPVEGWPRDEIRIMLESDGEYPLRRPYFPKFRATRRPRGFRRWASFARDRDNWNRNDCLRGNIRYAASDDDTNYTILGLILLERHGLDLKTEHVGEAWHEFLPYRQVCTAEHVAYANLIRGFAPPETATFHNPFRQWIGAQIRCDAFGYCAYGDPERAAAWAFADASLSHTRNGIYGEMFFAAMIAAATAGSSLVEAIDHGLGQIPRACRFAEMVRWLRGVREEEKDWERAADRVAARYGRLHSVHTINNAALVLLGLLWGEGSFHKTVTRAVLPGWDTDCNGATAGSVFGALHGADAIPAGYVRPLHDELHSSLAGLAREPISRYAERCFAVAERLRGARRSRKR